MTSSVLEGEALNAFPPMSGEMAIIAFITEVDPIQRVLNQLSERTTPPLIAAAWATLVVAIRILIKTPFMNRNKPNRCQNSSMI